MKVHKRKVLRLRNQALQSRKEIDWNKYKQARNSYNSEIRKAKNEYPNTIAQNLKENINNPNQWWNAANQLLKGTNYQSLPPLDKGNGELETNPIAKANILNKQFVFVEQTKLDEYDKEIGNLKTCFMMLH